MPSFFRKERGLLWSEDKKVTSAIIKDDYGDDCERCPFCGTLVPLKASDCRGCGALRTADPKEFMTTALYLFGWAIVIIIVYLVYYW